MAALAENLLAPVALHARARAWKALEQRDETVRNEILEVIESFREICAFDPKTMFGHEAKLHAQTLEDSDEVLGSPFTVKRSLELAHQYCPDLVADFDAGLRDADRMIRLVRAISAMLIGREDALVGEQEDVLNSAEDLLAAEAIRRDRANEEPVEPWPTAC